MELLKTLPRPFEGDDRVDYSDWAVKPDREVVDIIGDLNDPYNITIKSAMKAFSEAVHYLNVEQSNSQATGNSTNWKYALNCFGFICDNLMQGGKLNESEAVFLNEAQSVINRNLGGSLF